MLVIDLLVVLNFGIKLLQVCPHEVQLMILLTDLGMNCSQVYVLLFPCLSQVSDAPLSLFKLALKLIDSYLEAADIKVAVVDCLLQSLNV